VIDIQSATLAQRQVKPNYGSYMSEQEALDALVSRLVAALDPQMIWLFGSRARGDARPDSDFDLLVVAKADGADWAEDYENVYAPTMGSGIGTDVVPCDLEVYEASLGLRTSFVGRIVDEGRMVFSAGAKTIAGAAPHPPVGHLLPVKARGEGDNRERLHFPSPRRLRGEGGAERRMRGCAVGADVRKTIWNSTNNYLEEGVE
jgi:uncharacterized protein